MKKYVIVLALIWVGQYVSNGQVAQLYRANIVQTDTVKEVKLFDKEQYFREVERFKNNENSFDDILNSSCKCNLFG